MADLNEVEALSVTAVSYRQGDVILVRSKKQLTEPAQENIANSLKRVFPDATVAFLEDGLDLQFVRFEQDTYVNYPVSSNPKGRAA